MMNVLLAELVVLEDLGVGRERHQRAVRLVLRRALVLAKSTPCSNVASANSPSRWLRTVKLVERALTALVPTPLRPTLNWKTSSLYLAPVLICETHSTTCRAGCRGRSRARHLAWPSRVISTRLPWPMMNSSMALSTTSLSRM
jgi:hypothetical protein